MLWSLGIFLLLVVSMTWVQGHQQNQLQAQAQLQARLEAQANQLINRYVPVVDTGIVKPARACEAVVSKSAEVDQTIDPQYLAQSLPKYHPREIWKPADPSNYGERFSKDIHGQSVNFPLLVVLHETVGSWESAVSLFQTYHRYDEDQVSYHTIIGLDGTLIHVVPPEKRAFGAGNSEFQGESVKTNPRVASSVNNFAYHISLETPPDGMHEYLTHSGYTEAQYRSLAWLVARTRVKSDRVVYHKEVDRYGERSDPRSFDLSKFASLLKSYDILYETDCTLLALAHDQDS